MKKILTSLALIGLVATGTAAIAAEEAHNAAAPTHFPINEP
ncbi:cytochrome c1, partial [Mesorhizobium sp. M4B.F.Ca.ET.150.01.1.1]